MVLPRFLAELKHRNVYRAAVVYAAVGWMLLEAADVVFPRLGLPDWTVNLVLGLVLLGFPLAIVFAWIFDISGQGIIRTEPMSATVHHRFSVTSVIEFLLICILVATVGYLYVDRLSLQQKLVETEPAVQQRPGTDAPGVPNPAQYRAIAVLPFADMSEAGDQAWFAEGIAEELLQALARVPGLKVTARTSSFAFKKTNKTIDEIAEILGVQAVLEGSVRRYADRIRITAQLIDADSGYHIWSESYERQMTDLFLLQDELAQSIVKTLRMELGALGTGRLIAEMTDKPDAYNAFIRGRALYDWANPGVVNESIEYFERAVAADPHYAEAWGFLAFARAFSALWQSTAVANERSTIAAEKALALNPNQSEALTAKAWMTQLLDWDWQTAGKLYRRSLSSGSKPFAMMTYGTFYLANIDAIPRAIELLAAAEKLDPLHAGYKAILAQVYLWAGSPERALEKARESLNINPQHLFALMALIDAYRLMDDCPTALSVVEAMPESLQKEPRIHGRVGVCYALLGETDKARQIYDYVIEKTPYHYGNMQAAALAMTLGDVEGALDVLEAEVEKRSWPIVFVRIYFRHDERVSGNPRFQALLKRIGLDDESVAAIKENLPDR